MSQENVETARARYGEFARGDFSFIAELPDDFELVTTLENPDAGTYRGEAARRWLTAWAESFDPLTMEATEIIDAGDKVVLAVTQRGHLHGSPTVVEGRWWQVLSFRRGEVVGLATFVERADAFEAAGLPD